MKLQPIFPVAAMLAAFVVLLGATAYVVTKNQIKTKEKIFTLVRLSVIYILVLCIGLRPVIAKEEYEFSAKNLDVMFVVDTTLSMWAEDYNGKNTRMSGVMKDAEMIIDELAGCNFALVTFDDQAHVVSPYTQDMQYVRDLMETLTAPDSSVATGSSMSLPYKDIEALLLSSSKKENRKTVVFFMSDGEVTNGTESGSYAELAQYVDSGAVIGYGSESGGRMREGSWGYVYDYSSHTDAVSRIDEESLMQIASDLGIDYVNANKGNDAVKGKLEIIKETSKTVVDKGSGVESYKDIYFILAALLALMLLLELFIAVRKGRL